MHVCRSSIYSRLSVQMPLSRCENSFNECFSSSCTNVRFNLSVIEYDLQFCVPAIFPFSVRDCRQESFKNNIPYRETDQASDHSQNEIQTDCSPTFSFEYLDTELSHLSSQNHHQFADKGIQTNAPHITYERSFFRSLFLARRAQRGANVAFQLPRAIRLRKHGHDKTARTILSWKWSTNAYERFIHRNARS